MKLTLEVINLYFNLYNMYDWLFFVVGKIILAPVQKVSK